MQKGSIGFDFLKEENVQSELELIKMMLDLGPICCQVWDRNFNVIDCNEAGVKLYGFQNKQEYLERFFECSPEYQPDGMLTLTKAKMLIQRAFDEGKCVFEWMHQNPNDKTPMPAEVTLVKAKFLGQDVVLGYTMDKSIQKKQFEAIEYRDLLLKAVNDTASILAEEKTGNFSDTVQNSMKVLAKAVNVERMYIWKNHMKNEELCATQIYEYSEGAASQQDNEYTTDVPYDGGIPEMLEFENGINMNGPVHTFHENTCEHLVS